MRSALVWRGSKSNSKCVLIESEPLVLIDSHWQDKPEKPESGGILLGYRRGIHLHVTMATPPQAADRGWRYQFKRSSRHHQEIALQQWCSSDGMVDYLGEWHSHPQNQPIPSKTDLDEWRRICCRRHKPMVFLIVGVSGELWVGLSSGQELELCEPQTV